MDFRNGLYHVDTGAEAENVILFYNDRLGFLLSCKLDGLCIFRLEFLKTNLKIVSFKYKFSNLGCPGGCLILIVADPCNCIFVYFYQCRNLPLRLYLPYLTVYQTKLMYHDDCRSVKNIRRPIHSRFHTFPCLFGGFNRISPEV